MTLDPNAPEITTLSNNDLLEVYRGRDLRRITANNLAISINNNINGAVLPFVTVKQFGAVGNDNTDDTNAIQDAIDYAIANNIMLVWNTGIYRITSPLLIHIQKAKSFNMIGQGLNTVIKTNQSLDSVFDINEMADSVIDGFKLETFGTPIVDKMIKYYWDGTGRSTTRNTFRNIHISGRFKTGFQIGDSATANTQVDNTLYERLTVIGDFTYGNTTMHQYGVLCGDGTTGNNLLHDFNGLIITNCKVGFFDNRDSQVNINKASFSLNETDFLINSSRSFSVKNMHSEMAATFLTTNMGAHPSGQHITIEDCFFYSPSGSISRWDLEAFNPNDYLINCAQGGSYIFKNFFIGAVPDGVMPKLKLSGSNRKQYVELTNFRVALDVDLTNPSQLFILDTKTSVNAKYIARTSVNDLSWDIDDSQTYYNYEVINGVEQ